MNDVAVSKKESVERCIKQTRASFNLVFFRGMHKNTAIRGAPVRQNLSGVLKCQHEDGTSITQSIQTLNR
jgi:hypothetical protein